MTRTISWQRLATLGASLVLAAAMVGCGSDSDDACADAVDKLDQCDVLDDLEEQFGPASDECGDATDECVATCVNRSSCEDIQAGLSGTSNSFTSCVVDC